MENLNLDFRDKKLSKNNEKIANYIVNKMDLVPFMVEKDLAEACNVSISTISRFWEIINFKNFREFKKFLKQETSFSPADKIKTAFDKITDNEVISDIMLSSSNYIKQTVDRLDNNNFQNMVTAINQCSTLHIYASSSSACLSSLLEFRLKRFDIDVKVLTKSGHELFEDLIHIKKNDIIIIFGFTQESPEIKVLFDFAKNIGCKTVLITDLMVSSMIDNATFYFYTARGELWEFHSMLAPLALVESIIVSVGKAREKKSLDKLKRLQELRDTYEKLLPKKV
ncbi:MurR/RpiR family transcriptional regulator [Clostridium pasteurianum]|uniref:Transcriptional regulator n=1 Tax=Clostridium pasteurianum BC1 TaxID=86416 RepID=R4K5B2_CLOPA|nr:SIS domain-containing protein [Clostridium pasteurianum]AGK95719.1 transcriptional regulator [Clostridium pasteurianum BC1]